MSSEQHSFKRFSLNDRVQHIVLVVSFTLLAVTGIPQKYSSLPWAQVMIDLLGGIEVARLLHRISAAVLLAGFVYHIAYGLYALRVRRAAFDMLPRLKDFADLGHNIAYYLGFRKTRPRFDRFSYMEKFEYWALIWGTAIMALSGLALWFPILVTRYLPGSVVPGAKALHSNEALLAISAIVLWHLYNAHLNPRIFPFNPSIFTGRLTRHEMMTEHALEYERLTGERVPEPVLQEPAGRSWTVIALSGILGLLLVLLYVAIIRWTFQPPSPIIHPPLHAPVPRQAIINPYATPAPLLISTGPTPAPQEPCLVGRNSNSILANFKAVVVDRGGPVAGTLPQTFQFTDLSAGQINCWQWDFGDGETSLEPNPHHTYRSTCPGQQQRCTVSLTVCGPDGCATEKKFNYVSFIEESTEAPNILE